MAERQAGKDLHRRKHIAVTLVLRVSVLDVDHMSVRGKNQSLAVMYPKARAMSGLVVVSVPECDFDLVGGQQPDAGDWVIHEWQVAFDELRRGCQNMRRFHTLADPVPEPVKHRSLARVPVAGQRLRRLPQEPSPRGHRNPGARQRGPGPRRHAELGDRVGTQYR